MLPKQVFASLFFGLALCSPVQLRPRNADSPHAIPNRYIVVLKKGTSESSFTDHINKVNRRNEEYALQKREAPADPADNLSIGPFKCYSIKCNNATMSEILSSPEVDYVEQDQQVRCRNPSTPDTDSPAEDLEKRWTQEHNATWALHRMSHEDPPTDHFGKEVKYKYRNQWLGLRSTIYSIDAGIRTTHQEFTPGQAFCAKDFLQKNGKCADNSGFGTAYASLAVGKNVGVAKRARVGSLKAISDDGWVNFSTLVAAVKWVIDNVPAADRPRTVINIPFETNVSIPNSGLLDDLINQAYCKGIITVVAAGGVPTTELSPPGSAHNAITVGAVGLRDGQVSLTGYGPGVDIWAPGSLVRAGMGQSDTRTFHLNGSSISSALVAGLIAYFQSSYADGKIIGPGMIRKRMIDESIKCKIKILPEFSKAKINNYIANNGYKWAA